MSIRELYESSIKYECRSIAHYIFYLLREGLVKPDDDYSILEHIAYDHAKVDELIDKNYLGFKAIKAFALKIDDHIFAFIFAKSKQEAIDFCQKQLRKKAKNCHEYSLDFSISRGKEFLTFRDMKKEYALFPALIGFYEREVVYQ